MGHITRGFSSIHSRSFGGRLLLSEGRSVPHLPMPQGALPALVPPPAMKNPPSRLCPVPHACARAVLTSDAPAFLPASQDPSRHVLFPSLTPSDLQEDESSPFVCAHGIAFIRELSVILLVSVLPMMLEHLGPKHHPYSLSLGTKGKVWAWEGCTGTSCSPGCGKQECECYAPLPPPTHTHTHSQGVSVYSLML